MTSHLERARLGYIIEYGAGLSDVNNPNDRPCRIKILFRAEIQIPSLIPLPFLHARGVYRSLQRPLVLAQPEQRSQAR